MTIYNLWYINITQHIFHLNNVIYYIFDRYRLIVRFNMDKGLYTGMVFLDLRKAFDTVNHSILLQKLSNIGSNSSTTSWFKSYLTNRSQQVDLMGTLSTSRSLNCGVPQGSILGPLLFLLYVNDMSLATTCNLMLYADDSGLIVSGKSIVDIEKQLS